MSMPLERREDLAALQLPSGAKFIAPNSTVYFAALQLLNNLKVAELL
jgi:hypothetical protein